MSSALLIAAFVSATLAVGFLLAGVVALKRRRLFGFASGVTVGLLLLSLAALMGTITVATQGYRALTRE